MKGFEFNTRNFERLDEHIQKLVSLREVPNRSASLIYLFLRHRAYCEKSVIDECYTDGANDLGVDAIFIDYSSEDPVVNIFQSKAFVSESAAKKPFKVSCLEKIIRFMQVVKERRTDLSKVANVRLQQKITEIREAIDRDLPSFKVWLVSNGMPAVDHELSPLEALLRRDGIEVEQFNLDEVVEFCLNTHSQKSAHIFYARDVGVLETGSSTLRSVAGYISASELFRLIADMRHPDRVDYSIFHRNVRGFLGLDNQVNRQIFRSAASPSNFRFFALNNGITIVCAQCRVSSIASDAPKIRMKRPSIVNGAQTCFAIFSAMRDFAPDMSGFERLSVLFRIFETEDAETISEIAMSTNNQSRINPRDLRANDELQIDLEARLRGYGIRYIRKRGDYCEVDIETASIDALRVGQLLLSFVHRDPARARRDSDAIFTELYQKIFSKVAIEELLAAIRWMSLIEARRAEVEDDIRIKGASRVSLSFLVYGSFHVLMLCGLLSESRADVDEQEILSVALSIVDGRLAERGHPAHYTFFRDPAEAVALRQMAHEPRLI